MLDEDEHLFHNRNASVATLRELFAFGPECRSRSLRNQCSPSSESSILEAFVLTAEVSGREQVWTYVDSNRIGDHICYYSDLTKLETHYPDWGISKTLKQTVAEIAASWSARLPGPQ